MIKTYYFVRHGASTADSGEMELNGVNAPATADDIPLSDMGKEEAVRAGEFFARLGKIDGVYSSPLSRTHDTAKLIAAPLGLDVKIIPEVREADLSGLLDFFKKRAGKSPVKFGPKDVPFELFRASMRVTGGLFFLLWQAAGSLPDTECPEDVEARLEAAFDVLDSVPEQNIVVVSHGFFLTYMVSYFIRKEIANLPHGRLWVPNCSVTKVTSSRGKRTLKYFARDDYDNLK